MRILLVNQSPFDGSGSGTATAELAMALRRAGHEVRSLMTADRPDIAGPVPSRVIACSATSAQADWPLDFPAWTWHPASRLTYADYTDEQLDRLRELLRRELDREVSVFDPQVIHCQHTGPMAHLALETGVPYLVAAHATSLRVACADARLRPLAEQAAENASAVIASSDHLAAEIRAKLADIDLRLEVVRPELSSDWFDPDEPLGPDKMPAGLGFPVREGPLIVFAGTLVPRHGATTLLNAAAICESLHPTLRMVIIGDGPLAAELRLQAERLELQRTHFLGMQERFVCRVLFAEAKLVVVPSCESPSIWTVLEAQAAGTPVVASVGDGREEILSAESGTLVAANDHELLAEAILRGVAEDRKAQHGPLMALRAAQRADSARWALDTVALYERAIRERGGSV